MLIFQSFSLNYRESIGLPRGGVHDLSLGRERWWRLGQLLQLREAEVVLLAVDGSGLVTRLTLMAGDLLMSDLSGVRGHHLLLAGDLGLMIGLLLSDLTLSREEPSQMRGRLLSQSRLRALLLAANLALMLTDLRMLRGFMFADSGLHLEQCWSELFELLKNFNSKDRIVVFDIRVQSIFKPEHIRSLVFGLNLLFGPTLT